MDAQTWRVGSRCLLLLALVGSIRSEGVQSCEEVRKLFQGRLVGPVKGLPDSPRAGKARTVGAGLGAWARAGASGAWTLRCSSSRNGLSWGKLTFQVLRPHRVPPREGRCDHPECSAAPGAPGLRLPLSRAPDVRFPPGSLSL